MASKESTAVSLLLDPALLYFIGPFENHMQKHGQVVRLWRKLENTNRIFDSFLSL